MIKIYFKNYIFQEIGKSVGVLSGQVIGEPGTQWTNCSSCKTCFYRKSINFN